MFPSCCKNPRAAADADAADRHQCHRQPAASSSLITCSYQIQLCNSTVLLTLTWSKTVASHKVTVHAPELFSISIPLAPSSFSVFRTRPGAKSVSLSNTHNSGSATNVKVYWDFTKAEFDRVNSAAPDSSFYLALVCDGRVVFFIGDRPGELTRRVGSLGTVRDWDESRLVSRREHLFGRRSYCTTARFLNSKHEVEIECKGGTMRVKIDGKTKLVVKRLGWKFRGNEKVSIGELEVYFFWDVFNWVSTDKNDGHGVFVFQVGEGGGGIWPDMVGPEKKLMRKSSTAAATRGMVSPAPSWSSSVMQWAEESSDCKWSSASNSNSSRSCGRGSGGGAAGGFSLVLYAWRRD